MRRSGTLIGSLAEVNQPSGGMTPSTECRVTTMKSNDSGAEKPVDSGIDEKATIARNVIKQPEANTAGFGIAHVRNAPPHETEYRIEQLWPDGRAEPVFIGDKIDALRLVEELTKVIRRE